MDQDSSFEYMVYGDVLGLPICVGVHSLLCRKLLCTSVCELLLCMCFFMHWGFWVVHAWGAIVFFGLLSLYNCVCVCVCVLF